jgi:hypothetical protein
MVSIQTNHRKETTMQRAFALLLAALLLTGCRVVFVPVPVDVAGLTAPTPAPTLSPESLGALGPMDGRLAFKAHYDALDAPYMALRVLLEQPAFDDPAWRDATAGAAVEWRTAIEALRDMEQPQGTAWAAAWPVLQQALDEYHYAAGAIESAAKTNQPSLMEPVRARLINGVNLINEAMRLLGQE